MDNDDPVTARDELRRKREAAGLSLVKAGEQVGVAHSMMSEIERGKRTPSIELAIRIEREFGVALEGWTDVVDGSPLFTPERIESVRRFGIERAMSTDKPAA